MVHSNSRNPLPHHNSIDVGHRAGEEQDVLPLPVGTTPRGASASCPWDRGVQPNKMLIIRSTRQNCQIMSSVSIAAAIGERTWRSDFVRLMAVEIIGLGSLFFPHST